MISIAPSTYDIRGGLEFTPGLGSDLRSRTRRVSLTKTLDGGVAVYDGGFSDMDEARRVVLINPTQAQIDRAYEMISENTEVVISTRDGCYSGVIRAHDVRPDTLTLTLLYRSRLDT